MIRKILQEELEFEKRIFEKLSGDKQGVEDLLLELSKNDKYYYRHRGSSQRKYIRRSNRKLLRHIAGSRFIKEKISLLSVNIACLEDALRKIRDYDDESVIGLLPATYAKAVMYIRETDESAGVSQSENPLKRDELTVVCSNGLRVRTKGEMIIAEILIALDIEFRYEKALTLIDRKQLEDGTFRNKIVTVYPDFTIVLGDGSEMYWEHGGLFDEGTYRKKQHEKFDLYYDNGIYPPKNLIITMDGPGKAINAQEIRRIVEAVILPRT